MYKRAFCFLAAAGLVLAGCTSMPSGGGEMHRMMMRPANLAKSPDCHGQICEIDVVIDCSDVCTGAVDPKVLLVFGDQAGGPKFIRWTLAGDDQNFEFADVKVAFSDGSEFDCQAPGLHKKKVSCTDKFTKRSAVFSYTLKIVNSSTGQDLPTDPWIVNN